MNTPAIEVNNVGKAYSIGCETNKPDTLVGSIRELALSPIRRFKDLRSLDTSHADDQGLFWALKDVNFRLQQGDVLGILGNNGAGKSTLLKIISRITDPTRGSITIRGRVSSLLEVGTGFHPDLTGLDNIYMNGSILGMTRSEIRHKFDDIVDFSGVGKFLHTPVKRYSSGMQTRLAFSVAAHLEPEILIVDEVLAVGDAAFQKKCIGKMKDVSTSGRTVIFVSHNLAAIESICSRGLVMETGTQLFDGDIKTAVKHYRERLNSAIPESQVSETLLKSKSIESFELLDMDFAPTRYLALGKCLRVRISLRTQHLRLDRIRLWLGFDDIAGNRALTVEPPIEWDPRESENGLLTVTCSIPSVPLAPGTYTLALAIHSQSIPVEDTPKLCTLEIENGEINDTGRGFSRGSCIAASQWTEG